MQIFLPFLFFIASLIPLRANAQQSVNQSYWCTSWDVHSHMYYTKMCDEGRCYSHFDMLPGIGGGLGFRHQVHQYGYEVYGSLTVTIVPVGILLPLPAINGGAKCLFFPYPNPNTQFYVSLGIDNSYQMDICRNYHNLIPTFGLGYEFLNGNGKKHFLDVSIAPVKSCLREEKDVTIYNAIHFRYGLLL